MNGKMVFKLQQNPFYVGGSDIISLYFLRLNERNKNQRDPIESLWLMKLYNTFA